MPPNSSGAPHLPLKPTPMRRTGPQPTAGSSGAATTPFAVKRSEFEDFMNAYRPTSLDLPMMRGGEPPPPPPPKSTEDSSRVDFGKSFKRLIKRPQGSPSTQSKNHRKEGIQRTPTVVIGYPDDRGRHPQSERHNKPKRPLSANVVDSNLAPPQSAFGQGPTVLQPLDANLLLSKSETVFPPPPLTPPLSPLQSKSAPKSVTPPVPPPPVPPPPKGKPSSLQVPGPQSKASSPTTKSSPVQQQQPPPKSPKSVKSSKNGPQSEEVFKFPVPSSVGGTGEPPVSPPSASQQSKKKVSIQEEKRRSATEGGGFASDAHCLIIPGSNVGRFLPPRHNPDPILNMRVVPVPERKYHVILEFEESGEPPRPLLSAAGLLLVGAEEPLDTREQQGFFSWIRESHLAPMGMLLMNVERITEFPFLTYLVVGGGEQELSQKLKFIGERPVLSRRNLRFIAGYEEPVTITRPPASTFPEKPPSPDKTGFVVCLYQVLEGDDGVRFEQNWVMWTGARQIYRTLPPHMGLKRISVHKSVMQRKTVNYVLLCEFSNIMDHLTDACVIVDHLRARCCGFIGIYRILDAL